MGGTFVPFASGAPAIFSNSAALAHLEGPTAAISGAFLPFGEQFQMIGYGMGIGEFSGIGASIVKYGISDVPSYSADEQRIGTTGSQELAVSLGAGLGIGPGSVGATVRYLHFSPEGVGGKLTGYTVDLSGTVMFETAFLKQDWAFFSVALNNIAGELTGPRDLIPLDARFSGAYLYPLEERSTTTRIDPSGLVTTRRLRPRSYLLGAVEVRMSQFDSTPTVSGALEWAPLAESPVPFGLRLGFNSLADLAFGFFVDITPPVDFARDLRLDVATRRDYERGDITSHVTFTVEF
jgi:hypothetical protein